MVCRTHLVFWMVYYWKDMERLHNMEPYGYRKHIYLDEDWYSSMLAVHGIVMRHLWSWFNHVSTFPLVVWRGYPPYGTNSFYVMANGVPNSHAWVPEWRLCAAYVFSFPLRTGLNSIRIILSMFDYNNVFPIFLYADISPPWNLRLGKAPVQPPQRLRRLTRRWWSGQPAG